MSPESDTSVAPPGFAAPSTFVPVDATGAAGEAVPEPSSHATGSRRLPDLPWRTLAAIVLVVVLGIAAYGLINPATPSDAAGVRSVISTYEHALVAGDGVKACAQLTPMAQAGVVQAMHRLGYSGTCVGAAGLAGTQLRELLASASPAMRDRAQAVESASAATVVVAADGVHAFSSPYGKPIGFVRVGDRWMIASQGGHVARPRPAHVTGAGLQFANRADAICRVPTAKMRAVVAALGRAAQANSPRMGALLAAALHRADALGTPLYARLATMDPPADEAVTYREYLAANQQELANVRSAAQLADSGQAATAYEAVAGSATSGLVDLDAAALGFRSCD